MKEKYLNSAEMNNNPLINDLREDYELYKVSHHNKNIKTLLDQIQEFHFFKVVVEAMKSKTSTPDKINHLYNIRIYFKPINTN